MNEAAWAAVQVLGPTIDGLVGLATMFALAWRRGRGDESRRRVSLADALAGAAAASASFLMKAALVMSWVGTFGVIRLAALDLFVVLPAIGLVTLALTRRGARVGATPLVRVAAFASLLAAAVGVYAVFVEPYRVRFETATVALDPARAGEAAITVGVLADIQTDAVTERHFREIRRLTASSPDLIVIPGDYFRGRPGTLEDHLPSLRALLGELRAPGGVYFVMGDCEDPPEVRRIFDGLPVEVLVNEARTVRVKDRTVTIGGVELRSERAGARRFLRSIESMPGDEDVRLLVAHRPDAALLLQPDTRVDLVVAGHTHGGQVQLPWIGPIITLSDVPNRVAAGGLHEMDGRRIYVSRGLGWEGPPAPRIRFLAPPEISLITLRD